MTTTKQQEARESVSDLLNKIEEGMYGVDDDFDSNAFTYDVENLADELAS